MKSLNELDLIEESVGGLSAGIVGTVIGYPLDLVKTRMQTAGGGGSSLGILGVANQVIRKEGFFALYKGIGPPLISLSILNTMSFTSYSYFRDWFDGTNGWNIRNGVAGLMGTPVFAMISTVENLVKTQMQVDNVSAKRFQSSWHCVSTLVREHGVLVLYTGHGINTIREAAFCGSYFFVYEGIRNILLQGPAVPSALAIPMAGGMAGAFAWTFSFPLDCVRAGVQSRSLAGGNHAKSLSAFTVFMNLIREKGIAGLYHGVGPSVARAFLVSGTRFSAYEGALWLLRGGRDNHHGSSSAHSLEK
eukprot:CAMPEP_0116843648 /NCGR_PEP_ID=MMETSP0418-20121206/12207_1 /TAXON_ID=1158023 /ORGANISM="Astrosyne radiata, Strain 13vi08-1A" /LENGTH=303 /DNA_ID=CAMNT_0004474429 /DNA_START=907 /DNA_END=1818 /DNA_ORIENTATION=-